jgi:hypothetical protein
MKNKDIWHLIIVFFWFLIESIADSLNLGPLKSFYKIFLLVSQNLIDFVDC